MRAIAARANENRPGLGIVMMLGAYFLFALVDTSVKWLVVGGLHAFQLAFMRYAGAFVISMGQILVTGGSFRHLKTDHLGLVLLRAFLLLSATVVNFFVLKYLPLTLTSAIMFSAPVIVCALSWPLLGERVGPVRWGAIVLGFVGVLIIVRPFSVDFQWLALLSVYNALSMALYSIITRKLSGKVAIETMQFYLGFTGAVTMLPFGVWFWQTPTSVAQWGFMLALGIWAWAGHELLTRAHGFAPTNTLMPFTYSFLLYLTASGYLVFAHVPDQMTIFGALVVVVSGLIIWSRERRSVAVRPAA